MNLIAGQGLDGDRYNYALQTGTYSASFIDEPGKNCTLVSADAVEKQMAATGMKPFEGGMGALRRNLVVRGLSGDELNDMVGHEVQIGACRLFVHRRTVPCKYHEAQCKRPGLMNRLWDVCGVNCEILKGGTVLVGDEVAVIPGTHQPKRVNPGTKPPGFFVRPRDRTHEEHASMIIPPAVAFGMCLALNPRGTHQRVNTPSQRRRRRESNVSLPAGRPGRIRAHRVRLPLGRRALLDAPGVPRGAARQEATRAAHDRGGRGGRRARGEVLT